MIMEPRNESRRVFNRRCQDANTIAMYGLSKSFTIKFLLVFNIRKYSFCNITNSVLILWRLTEYECGCYLLDRRNVLWRKCQPNGTMNSMMKQCQWKERQSKDRVKVSLLMRPNSNVTLLMCPSLTLKRTWYVAPNVNVHNTLTSAVEGKRGRARGGGALL